jgi:hypothetical protein
MVDFLCNTCNRHSDKTGERFFHIVIPLFIGIIGFVIATLTMNLAARYLALYVRYLISPIDMHLTIHSFLMAQSLTGYICFLTWMSNTFVHSPSKRAVALAFVNAFSQLGNVGSSYVLRIIFDILTCDRYFDEQIRVANVLGSYIYSLIRHLHFNERAWYCYVSHLQTGACQPEQASGATRVLSGKAKIPTLRINVFLRHTIPGIRFDTAGPCITPLRVSF